MNGNIASDSWYFRQFKFQRIVLSYSAGLSHDKYYIDHPVAPLCTIASRRTAGPGIRLAKRGSFAELHFSYRFLICEATRGPADLARRIEYSRERACFRRRQNAAVFEADVP